MDTERVSGQRKVLYPGRAWPGRFQKIPVQPGCVQCCNIGDSTLSSWSDQWLRTHEYYIVHNHWSGCNTNSHKCSTTQSLVSVHRVSCSRTVTGQAAPHGLLHMQSLVRPRHAYCNTRDHWPYSISCSHDTAKRVRCQTRGLQSNTRLREKFLRLKER